MNQLFIEFLTKPENLAHLRVALGRALNTWEDKPEELVYISDVLNGDAAIVKDGFIRKGDRVWWLCEDGPMYLRSLQHPGMWDNILNYPHLYQIADPRPPATSGYMRVVPGVSVRNDETMARTIAGTLDKAYGKVTYVLPALPETKPCSGPYCECDKGKCTHPGFHDARGLPSSEAVLRTPVVDDTPLEASKADAIEPPLKAVFEEGLALLDAEFGFVNDTLVDATGAPLKITQITEPPLKAAFDEGLTLLDATMGAVTLAKTSEERLAAPPTQHVLGRPMVDVLTRMLNELLMMADEEGYVITVETVPCKPLAMGNHKMVGSVRPAQ